jgi:hypothetical protein
MHRLNLLLDWLSHADLEYEAGYYCPSPNIVNVGLMKAADGLVMRILSRLGRMLTVKTSMRTRQLRK